MYLSIHCLKGSRPTWRKLNRKPSIHTKVRKLGQYSSLYVALLVGCIHLFRLVSLSLNSMY